MNITQNDLLQSALLYASLGWQVIPLHTPENNSCTCGNRECKSVGKHPRTKRGFKDATTEVAIITGWFSKWPNANIGIVTGSQSNIWIIDEDPRNGGKESLKDLENINQKLPTTLEVKSGGDGRHFYFKAGEIKIRKGKLAAGVDFQADGAYIVAPPSLHQSGKRYAWIDNKPSIEKLADLPKWVLESIGPKPFLNPPNSNTGTNGINEGNRHTYLVKLAGGLQGKGVSSEAIKAALSAENLARCKPPLDEKEVDSIVISIGRYQPSSPLVLAPYSDVGNASRLIAFTKGNLRFLIHKKRWIAWNGKFWTDEEKEFSVKQAKELYDLLRQFAASEELTKEFKKNIKRLGSESGIRSMVNLARPDLPISQEEMDQDPWLLSTENGTLDLRTGHLREHRRADYISKMVPIKFEPQAKCEKWTEYLLQIFSGDEEMIAFVKRAVGYSLTGRTDEQMLLFCYGTGANGKSTFVEILRLLLSKYAVTADFTSFAQRKNDSIRNDLARLCGARLVTASEIAEGRVLDETIVKQITGKDTISARFLFGEFFEFKPQFKLWIVGNQKPKIVGQDHGIWRRILFLPFEVTIPESKRDRNLLEKLSTELSGILTWAVEGCIEWQREGLRPTEKILSATHQYRKECDLVGRFVEERVTALSTATTPIDILYEAFQNWAFRQHEVIPSKIIFDRRLKELGFVSRKGTNGRRIWQGLGLLESGESGSFTELDRENPNKFKGPSPNSATPATERKSQEVL